MTSWLISFCSGRFCLRIARAIASLPCSIASSRRSLVNQLRILLRARGLLTKFSQSWLGPASGFFEVKTSTTSPLEQRALERHEAAVDLRAHRAVPDLGVHGVGEVDGGRARRAGR